MIEPVLLTMVGAAMIGAAAYDAATLTIPNWISLVLIALFPLVALSADLSWSEIGVHVAVGFAALVIGIGLFAARMIGGGDAKLFAAIALYMGGGWIGVYVFTVALAGGALAVVLLALRWIVSTGLAVRFAWLGHLAKAGAGIPYGIAIAAAGLLVFPATHLFALAAH